MPVDEITGGFTFFGYIPDGSDKQHLGIVLGTKDALLKYCYGTSQFVKITNNTDFVKIPVAEMSVYFQHPKETYIFLSPRHIIDMLLITFKSRIGSEYDIKPPMNKDIFVSILSKIKNSDNLPERFKQEFFEFLE
jgi:hypothetical protein